MTKEVMEQYKYRAFYYEKEEAIQVAKDLCYDEDIIRRLERATTLNQLGRILKEARTREED